MEQRHWISPHSLISKQVSFLQLMQPKMIEVFSSHIMSYNHELAESESLCVVQIDLFVWKSGG